MVSLKKKVFCIEDSTACVNLSIFWRILMRHSVPFIHESDSSTYHVFALTKLLNHAILTANTGNSTSLAQF